MLQQMWSDLRFRVRALLHRGAMEQELRDELRFHVEKETEKLVLAGVPRDEAARRARIAFGGVEQIAEDTRDARGVVLVETLLQDLRYAARGLRARPGFTLGIVLTLALGIGANAAMFGIVDRLLLRPPPALADPGHVHRVYVSWITQRGERRIDRNYAYPTYLDFQRWSRTVEEWAAFQTRDLAVGEGDDVRELPVTLASASYFDFFDARPALGRFFAAEEDSVPVGAPVVVLGYDFWQTRYSGRADILGEELRIGQMPATIIGVAPEGFVGMSDQGVPVAYIPITAYAFTLRGDRYPTNYGWSWLEIMARRRDGVEPNAVDADLTSVFRRSWVAEAEAMDFDPRLETTRPAAMIGPPQLERGPDATTTGRVVVWVGGVAIVVLLIACANVANLLLARAATRRREIAMRRALGASRGRLVRQMLTESFLLAGLGGAAGLLVAEWGGAVLRALFLTDSVPAGAVTDARTLGFTALATVATALLTGLVPAIQGGQADLAGSIKTGMREGVYRRSRTRTGLVIFQATLSVVLLVGAGLFARSLDRVRSYRLGYDVEPVLFANANPRGVRLDDAAMRALQARMLETAQTTPGVTHAALAASVPFWSNEGRGLWVPGVDSVGKLGTFVLQAGSADYFATVGTRILRGRGFEPGDRADAPPVVVVSDAMARVLWPGEDALGRCIRIGADTAPCSAVVGIAENSRLRLLSDTREFTYYVPLDQLGDAGYPQLFARVRGEPAQHVGTLQRRLQAILPGAAYVTVRPLRELVDPNYRAWELGTTMFLAFGGLAFLLAVVGLYSVVAYGVTQRLHELGIRIALGAPVRHLLRLVVVGGLSVVGVGVIIGAAVALWAGRWAEPLLFQQPARDPVVFAVVALVLLVAALAASVVPARRALRVDPNLVLRAD